MTVSRDALGQATDRFTSTLEDKWEKERKQREKLPRCMRCGSHEWVSVSLDGGCTRRYQCVPCGAIGDLIPVGDKGPKGEDAGAVGLEGVRGKTEALTSEQPQDGVNAFADGETLEPVEAHKFSMCSICHSYIERGESIVSADGTAWVHTVCARQAGWPIAGDA